MQSNLTTNFQNFFCYFRNLCANACHLNFSFSKRKATALITVAYFVHPSIMLIQNISECL